MLYMNVFILYILLSISNVRYVAGLYHIDIEKYFSGFKNDSAVQKAKRNSLYQLRFPSSVKLGIL